MVSTTLISESNLDAVTRSSLASATTGDRKKHCVFLFALAAFLLLDTAVFRSGWYQQILEPYSSAGMYLFQKNHALFRVNHSKHLIAFLGDSRMLEGFSVKDFCRNTVKTEYVPALLDVPATSLRVWYYLLKQVDPKGSAFEAVVVPLVSYSNVDERDDPNERALDASFLAPHLSFGESIDLLASYADDEIRARILLGCAVKMYAYRLDVQGLLFDPKQRLRNIRHWKREDELLIYNYDGRPNSLVGIVEEHDALSKGTSTISDLALQRLNHRVHALLPPQSGRQKKYNDYWLNRLVDHYSNTGTKIIVYKIPTDPFQRKIPIPDDYSTITRLSKQKIVAVLPENLFQDLSAPDYFWDDMHLNQAGRRVLTRRLTSAVLQVLTASPHTSTKLSI
jgi:hypothetical protein